MVVIPSGSVQVAGWVPASCQPACSYRAMAGSEPSHSATPGGHHAAGGDPAAGIVRPSGRVAAGLVHAAQHGDARGQVPGWAGPDQHASSRRVRRVPRTRARDPRPGALRRAAGARAAAGLPALAHNRLPDLVSDYLCLLQGDVSLLAAAQAQDGASGFLTRAEPYSNGASHPGRLTVHP